GIFARSFEATGGVAIRSDTMSFAAENVKGAMHRSPSVRPDDKLSALTFLQASKNVLLKLKDEKTARDSTASADQLDIKGSGDQQVIELTGSPEATFVDAAGDGLQSPTI